MSSLSVSLSALQDPENHVIQLQHPKFYCRDIRAQVKERRCFKTLFPKSSPSFPCKNYLRPSLLRVQLERLLRGQRVLLELALCDRVQRAPPIAESYLDAWERTTWEETDVYNSLPSVRKKST